MKAFSDVNQDIKVRLGLHDSEVLGNKKVTDSADISRRIRDLISIKELRDTGSFFTSDALANEALIKLRSSITESSVFFDPTCGVGNLLLAASDYLPVTRSLDKTIDDWAKKLAGVDLHAEFVSCTKLRLIQRAMERGAKLSSRTLSQNEEKFTHIVRGNIFHNLYRCQSATHILLNPPYFQRTLPKNRSWSTGRINMAAVFMEDIISSCEPGTSYVAILPEVLRCGSRYQKWRGQFLSELSVTTSVESIGKFDKHTDVDVFVLSGKKRNRKSNKIDVTEFKSKNTQKSILSVSSHFDVSIGPLVAYRDPEVGKIAPFVKTSSVRLWAETQIEGTRITSTKLFRPPFVVINRTSSPSDKIRARSSIVVGIDPVAVENHLVILMPKKGGLKMCKKLVSNLKDQGTNAFLNERIRCRHLTVSAVREIPWRQK